MDSEQKVLNLKLQQNKAPHPGPLLFSSLTKSFQFILG